jgi:uncharacterized membrane-anchored protein YhcB (DUF1043 family)
MKKYFPDLIKLAVGLLIGFILFKSCNPKTDELKSANDILKQEYQKQIQKVVEHEKNAILLQRKNDSLDSLYVKSQKQTEMMAFKLDSMYKGILDTSELEKIRKEYEKMDDVTKLSIDKRVKFFTKYFSEKF